VAINHNQNGDSVYHSLKEDIITLKLKPGQKISENEIASIYNVSRTPIKTAFQRLQGEKYIDIVPQKGSFVTLLDMKYIRDVIYMRMVLELDMLRSIIENGLTEKTVSSLRLNLDEQRSLINSNHLTPSSFYEIDSAFHNILFCAVGRECMWDVIQGFQVYYTRFRILDTLTTERYEELFNNHLQIIDALEKENFEELSVHIKDHLHSNLRRLDSKIKNEYSIYFVKD